MMTTINLKMCVFLIGVDQRDSTTTRHPSHNNAECDDENI